MPSRPAGPTPRHRRTGLRQALQFGFFTPAELAEARANLRQRTGSGRRQGRHPAFRRKSPTAWSTASPMKRSTPRRAQDLALDRPALAAITPGDCLAALRLAFSPAGRNVMVEGNAAIPGRRRGRHRAAAYRFRRPGRNGRSAPATWPRANSATPISEPPGRIVSPPGYRRPRHHRSRVRQWGAGKPQADAVRGPPDPAPPPRRRRAPDRARNRPGLGLFSDLTFASGGLGRHSADDLQTLLAGRTVGFEFAARDDAFEMTAATNRDDLLLQLQLFAAYLTDPGYSSRIPPRRPQDDRPRFTSSSPTLSQGP